MCTNDISQGVNPDLSNGVSSSENLLSNELSVDLLTNEPDTTALSSVFGPQDAAAEAVTDLNKFMEDTEVNCDTVNMSATFRRKKRKVESVSEEEKDQEIAKTTLDTIEQQEIWDNSDQNPFSLQWGEQWDVNGDNEEKEQVRLSVSLVCSRIYCIIHAA